MGEGGGSCPSPLRAAGIDGAMASSGPPMLALCGLSVHVVSLVHANRGVTKKTCVSACAVMNSVAEKNKRNDGLWWLHLRSGWGQVGGIAREERGGIYKRVVPGSRLLTTEGLNCRVHSAVTSKDPWHYNKVS